MPASCRKFANSTNRGRGRNETYLGGGAGRHGRFRGFCVASFAGSDPVLKNEYVVLSAHLDHLGIGEPINGDRIYNGAMDDASGVAALLDAAQTFHESQAKTRRSLLFVVVCGEEKGLLGSRYFASHPTVDVADINVAKPLGVEIQDDPAPQRNVSTRGDQYNFIRSSKEEAMEKAWLTQRYHAPSDDLSQPVDLQAAGEYNRMILTLARAVADNTPRPQWKSDSFFRRFARYARLTIYVANVSSSSSAAAPALRTRSQHGCSPRLCRHGAAAGGTPRSLLL
jgi:hypothetical protein